MIHGNWKMQSIPGLNRTSHMEIDTDFHITQLQFNSAYEWKSFLRHDFSNIHWTASGRNNTEKSYLEI